jgi:large subunit ribosomal protein L4e
MSTKVPVMKVDGAKKGDVSLPGVFATAYRPDIIMKAVNAAQANRRQVYGPAPMAGAMHSTKSAGKGRGLSRVPRKVDSNEGALAPPTVGGRRAHPPSPRRIFHEKVNIKERRLATQSAIAATGDRQLVAARGHRIGEKLTLPVVVDAAFEKLAKTQEVMAALEKLGLGEDLARASDGVHVRAGRGKMRGRRFRKPRSLLIVAKDAKALLDAAGNLPGVEILSTNLLNAEALAPGGVAGRLAVFTEAALKDLEALK